MKNDLKVCLWFDGNAEDAAKFYIDVFKDAKIINRSFYGNEGFEYHGKTPGTLLTIELQLKSFNLLLLNGDHSFKFNESVSLVIECDTQEEVDYYWQRLTYKAHLVFLWYSKKKRLLFLNTMLKYHRKRDDNMKERKVKGFIMTTMNGMVYGLFATLIIGVIIKQIGALLDLALLEVIIYERLAALLGVGIGIGIGISLQMTGLKLVVAGVIGGIASAFTLMLDGTMLVGLAANEPVKIYLVTIFGIILLEKILVKRTPVDILLIPLTGVALAVILTLVIGGPVRLLITYIQEFITWTFAFAPIPMSIVVAVVMGILLTSPLSSAAIAISINLTGIAGGAAVIGCTAQMIGFAVQSRKDNSIGMVLSIAFGTSMLQFKNILRKPIIWLPTIIASAILGPIFYIFFKTSTTSAGAGMGSSGFVGQLQTLAEMNYSTNAWLSVVLMLVLSAALVFGIDLIFRKKGWIVEGDLAVNKDINS